MGDDVSRKNWDLDLECSNGDAPLYEVEMRYPDTTTVMRLTDRVPEVGETIECRGGRWDVVRVTRDPESIRGTARFLCVLAARQRERALVMQADDELRRRRLHELRERFDALIARLSDS